MASLLPAQLQGFTLYGSGALTGDTTVVLTTFTDIAGNLLTMANFGTIGYGTIEPNTGVYEEQISFSGVTQNSNGTATLTGVKHVLFLSPYTETSGLATSHTGGVTFVISNTSAFYNTFTNRLDAETISALWQFPNDANTPILGSSYVAPTLQNQVASKGYADSLAIAGSPNATTSVQGLVQLATQAQHDARTGTGSTGASLAATPVLNRTVLTHDYAASSAGTDTYAITPTPAVTAYTTGDIYYFKADVANTGACTLNVATLGAKALKVYGLDPRDNYIKANAFVQVQYDGTNMEILSVSGQPQVSQDGLEIYAADAQANDTYVITLVPAPAAYATGMVVRFKANTVNTGAATLNVNGLGAISILRPDGSALANGDIAANQLVEVIYGGTNFTLLSPVANASKYAHGVTTRAGDAANGAQNIAHGLGRAPRFVRLTANKAFGTTTNGITAISVGQYDGSTTSAIYSVTSIPGTTEALTDTTNAIHIEDTASGSAQQVAVVTVDATNIILTFTKTGSPNSANINILWAAEV